MRAGWLVCKARGTWVSGLQAQRASAGSGVAGRGCYAAPAGALGVVRCWP